MPSRPSPPRAHAVRDMHATQVHAYSHAPRRARAPPIDRVRVHIPDCRSPPPGVLPTLKREPLGHACRYADSDGRSRSRLPGLCAPSRTRTRMLPRCVLLPAWDDPGLPATQANAHARLHDRKRTHTHKHAHTGRRSVDMTVVPGGHFLSQEDGFASGILQWCSHSRVLPD